MVSCLQPRVFTGFPGLPQSRVRHSIRTPYQKWLVPLLCVCPPWLTCGRDLHRIYPSLEPLNSNKKVRNWAGCSYGLQNIFLYMTSLFL